MVCPVSAAAGWQLFLQDTTSARSSAVLHNSGSQDIVRHQVSGPAMKACTAVSNCINDTTLGPYRTDSVSTVLSPGHTQLSSTRSFEAHGIFTAVTCRCKQLGSHRGHCLSQASQHTQTPHWGTASGTHIICGYTPSQPWCLVPAEAGRKQLLIWETLSTPLRVVQQDVGQCRSHLSKHCITKPQGSDLCWVHRPLRGCGTAGPVATAVAMPCLLLLVLATATSCGLPSAQRASAPQNGPYSQ